MIDLHPEPGSVFFEKKQKTTFRREDGWIDLFQKTGGTPGNHSCDSCSDSESV